jgi:hypothetical protein
MHSLLEAYLSELAAHLSALPTKPRVEELREMRAHLENAVAGYRAQGSTDEEAAQAALAQFVGARDHGGMWSNPGCSASPPSGALPAFAVCWAIIWKAILMFSPCSDCTLSRSFMPCFLASPPCWVACSAGISRTVQSRARRGERGQPTSGHG